MTFNNSWCYAAMTLRQSATQMDLCGRASVPRSAKHWCLGWQFPVGLRQGYQMLLKVWKYALEYPITFLNSTKTNTSSKCRSRHAFGHRDKRREMLHMCIIQMRIDGVKQSCRIFGKVHFSWALVTSVRCEVEDDLSSDDEAEEPPFEGRSQVETKIDQTCRRSYQIF